MIYLACPYSHPDPAIREARFQAACRAAANLLLAGECVFAPVVYGHPLVAMDTPGVPGDWNFWSRLDHAMIERIDEVRVLALPGWDTSVGVRQEVLSARSLGKPVTFVTPANAALAKATPAVATGWPTFGPRGGDRLSGRVVAR
ncbi:MAG: DUF1937 family protein [Gemmataceae bacterium]|nr:DUF1937 family protein [Gemmataceae bacterium]